VSPARDLVPAQHPEHRPSTAREPPCEGRNDERESPVQDVLHIDAAVFTPSRLADFVEEPRRRAGAGKK
jgi:hypothetical protein